jgi:hypothetical protein
MKLDSNIYGADETSCAHEVADMALSAPKLVDPFDHANASKGGGGDAVVSNSDAIAKDVGGGKDSRAVSRGGHAVSSGTSAGKKER